MAPEDEDDFFSNSERDYGDELFMEWAMVSVKWFSICFSLIKLK